MLISRFLKSNEQEPPRSLAKAFQSVVGNAIAPQHFCLEVTRDTEGMRNLSVDYTHEGNNQRLYTRCLRNGRTNASERLVFQRRQTSLH